jgi:hypothetical protein
MHVLASVRADCTPRGKPRVAPMHKSLSTGNTLSSMLFPHSPRLETLPTGKVTVGELQLPPGASSSSFSTASSESVCT